MTFPNPNFEAKWPNPPAEPTRSSPIVPWMIGCGVLMFLGLMVVAAGVLWLANAPESGVKLANQMENSELDYLARHKILNGTERVVAYFDVTISMTGTESATVTTERVIYHKDGRNTAIPLAEIADVRHEVDALGGYTIEVISEAGDRMKIEIPPLNGGKTFLDALNDTRRLREPVPLSDGPGLQDTAPPMPPHSDRR